MRASLVSLLSLVVLFVGDTMPPSPFQAATPETTTSGADVPHATTVSPTTRVLTPIRRARLVPPPTSQPAPLPSRTIPTTRYTPMTVQVSTREILSTGRRQRSPGMR